MNLIVGLDRIVQTPDGNKVVDQQGKPLTYKDLLFQACWEEPNPEVHKIALSGQVKMKAYELSKVIKAADGEVELEPEDVVLLKELAAFGFNIPAYGVFMEFLKNQGSNKGKTEDP